MKKYLWCLLVIIGLAGCGTKHFIVDSSNGIDKYESRSIAVEHMGGAEPCGYRELYDTWRWDFRIKRPGYVTTQEHVYVNKITGKVVEGIK